MATTGRSSGLYAVVIMLAVLPGAGGRRARGEDAGGPLFELAHGGRPVSAPT